MIPWGLLWSKTWPIFLGLAVFMTAVYGVRFVMRRWKNMS